MTTPLADLTITDGSMIFDGGSIILNGTDSSGASVDIYLSWSFTPQAEIFSYFMVNRRIIAIGSEEELLWVNRLKSARVLPPASSSQDADAIGTGRYVAASSDIQDYIDAAHEGPEAAIRQLIDDLLENLADESYQSQAKYLKVVPLDTNRITDWDTFHTVFAETFGFPDTYERNMDAWIDCMSSLRAPSARLTSVHTPAGGKIVLHVEPAEEFAVRCPDQYTELLRCAAIVNERTATADAPETLALWFLCPIEQSLEERIHAPILEYTGYDGPRIGTTLLQGKPYRFRSRNLDDQNQPSQCRPVDLFDLTPVHPDPDSSSFVATLHARYVSSAPSQYEAYWLIAPSEKNKV